MDSIKVEIHRETDKISQFKKNKQIDVYAEFSVKNMHNRKVRQKKP